MKKLILLLILAAFATFSKAQTNSIQQADFERIRKQADAAFTKEDYSKAAGLYKIIVGKEPKNVNALRRLGYIYSISVKSETDAIETFNKVLAIDPTDNVSYYYLGDVYTELAKAEIEKQKKSDFKAKAAFYFERASKYGNTDAKAAIKELNGI